MIYGSRLLILVQRDVKVTLEAPKDPRLSPWSFGIWCGRRIIRSVGDVLIQACYHRPKQRVSSTASAQRTYQPPVIRCTKTYHSLPSGTLETPLAVLVLSPAFGIIQTLVSSQLGSLTRLYDTCFSSCAFPPLVSRSACN